MCKALDLLADGGAWALSQRWLFWLSTTVFVLFKGQITGSDQREFRARVHPGRLIEENSPGLNLTTAAIPLYDPSNFTIVSCDQADWDLAVRILQSGRMDWLGRFCTSYQGEVNEANEKEKDTISSEKNIGPLILRGSNICLYAVRSASQGNPYYLRVEKFLKGKKANAKAFHAAQVRLGFQRSAPQNNFRRLVAAIIGKGNYCFDTVSYVPESESRIPLHLILGLLNSKLLDWYFRLGSTNSKVNEYQFNNLPCPMFADAENDADRASRKEALKALASGKSNQVVAALLPGLAKPPFSPAVKEVILEVEVPRSWLRRSRKRLWYCGRDIPPVRFGRLISFTELASPSVDESPAPKGQLVRMAS